MFQKLLGFLPDEDPTTPGIITDCQNIYHTESGVRSMPSETTVVAGALPTVCYGARELTSVSDSPVTYAGTATKLYYADTLGWTDVSRPTTAYGASSDKRWCFAAQGNLRFAQNGSDTPQVTTSLSSFSNGAATFPIAKYIDVVDEFIHLAYTVESGSHVQNRYWFSKDYTLWTPDVATQCVKGLIADTPGAFTGLRRFKHRMIYYKKFAMHEARYVGPPYVYGFDTISDSIGAVTNESIVVVGDVHYFVGYNNIYKYDGGVPVPIGDGIARWLFTKTRTLTAGFGNVPYDVYGVYDSSLFTIFWKFKSLNLSGPTYWWTLSYNIKTGGWGYGSPANQPYAACNYTKDGRSYAAVIDSANLLKTISGTPEASYYETGYIGRDDRKTNFRSIRPRATTAISASATLTPKLYSSLGVQSAAVSDVTYTNRKFDILRTDNWLKFKVTHPSGSDIETLGYTIDAVDAGV